MSPAKLARAFDTNPSGYVCASPVPDALLQQWQPREVTAEQVSAAVQPRQCNRPAAFFGIGATRAFQL
jgi:hypothetical protein